MLTAAIQKEYTIVCFIQSKSNFKFPYMEFPYISFSKGKEFNNELMTGMAMLDCFLILFARERSLGKRQAKICFYGKTFS